MIYFVVKRIHLQLKVVKYYPFKWKRRCLLCSQESPKSLPAKKRCQPKWIPFDASCPAESSPKLLYSHVLDLICSKLSWFQVIIAFYGPHFLKWNKTEILMIILLYWLYWNYQQGRYPKRKDISQNNSLYTTDQRSRIIYLIYTFAWWVDGFKICDIRVHCR